MGVVARGRVGEEDSAVGRDVAVVGIAQPRIVDDRRPGAVGLGREFRHFACLRDRIEPHGADAAQQIAGAVEGEAKRKAADMGEDFRALIVGREEADDLAMARAAIEMIVAVQDDVLGPFQLAEADRRRFGQPVVEGIGAAGSGQRRLRLAHAVIDRRDIDLVQHLVPVLQPADVQGHRRGQHQAQHHLVGAGAIAQADQAVGHDQHDDRAHDALGDRAAPAAQAVAAHHGGGQRHDLEIQTGAGSCAAQAAGDQEAGETAAETGDDIGHEHGLAHADAGIVGGAARAADRQDMPARTGPRDRDMRDDRR